ncbi:DegT/DnrJ/EryC1/StrS family aminotransferase [Litorivicinus sp.]|nr:DegT/DnrJ/EryC1/StrS family aminotransferase [Litorivicinus sp.]MDC1239998.1 DegT/DnrJ/EryC1/StrS family aminotransferase [Litorivicinus sp.]
MIEFLDLHSQYLSIKDEIDLAIKKVIGHSAFIGGKNLKSFEENFAEYQQAAFCVGVGNGTDALEIAIEALNLPMNSEIIVPANSFIASAEAVSRAGHKIVFCDVNPNDFTINIEDLNKKITCNTSAIIAVHLYGHPCDMEELLSVATRFGLKIIEDAAQAHGAEYDGKRVGGLGDIGCFSFYPGKNLGAYGDGGAIVTNNEELSIKCRMIANHGRKAKYDHAFEGRNSRLDGLQAAILDVKLRHLESWTEKRILLAESYSRGLHDCSSVIIPIKKERVRHVYHLFVVRVLDRAKTIEKLEKNGVQTGIHYPIALPKLEAFRYLDQECGCEFACTSDDTLLSLPIGEHLRIEDVRKVCDLI